MTDKTTDCGSVSAELAALVADLRGEGDCWSADRVEQTITRLRDTECRSVALADLKRIDDLVATVSADEILCDSEDFAAWERIRAALDPFPAGRPPADEVPSRLRRLADAVAGGKIPTGLERLLPETMRAAAEAMEQESVSRQKWLERESELVARMVWPSFDEDPEPWRRSMRVGAAAAAIMQTSQTRPEPRKDAAEAVRGWLSCEHLSMSGALPAMEQESVADESDDDLIDCDPTPPRYQRVVAKQGTADDLDLCYNGGLGPIRNRDAWAMEHGWPELCREVVMAMGEKSVD